MKLPDIVMGASALKEHLLHRSLYSLLAGDEVFIAVDVAVEVDLGRRGCLCCRRRCYSEMTWLMTKLLTKLYIQL